jgi:branched-chain amino acid transport system permease protein
MSAEAPAAASRVDFARAFKDAAVAALLAFGLFLPLIGFETVQNIRNELVLETRWPLLFNFVALVTAAHLFGSLVVTPWRERRGLARRRGEATASHAPSWLGRLGRRLCYVIGLGVCFIGVVNFGSDLTEIIDFIGAPSAGAGFTVLAALLLTGFLIGVGYVFMRFGSGGAAAVGHLIGPAGVGFLVVFPIVALLGAGWGGAVKWIDNFGIQILIYVMLGLGLNIVVGLAGLLDLGYVAFYAVGAYSYALLAKTFGFSFWILLPLAGILAALWGVMLGFPVLRLRGDYLAIVTLAFGEIIRLVLINWVPVTNGYAGIGGIPRPTFFGIPFNASDQGFAAMLGLEFSPVYRIIFLYYVILGLVLLTAYVTMRLRRLPIGRAWEALREDEIACRSLGINTTNTKLTAFALGAMFGGIAGSFFATRQGFISPESFSFMESALILSIVVLGGMGSQVGVGIAAIAMIGGTEVLRELDFLKAIFGSAFDPTQYRMLIFGFALVLIMIWKPRGLIATREPSAVFKEKKIISGSLVKEGRG